MRKLLVLLLLSVPLPVVIAEATGRRLGSRRQLAWEDIDFARDTILWRADTDKKGKAWTILMPATLRDEIKVFRGNLGSAFGLLVFPSESDDQAPVRTNVFSRWLRKAEKKARLHKQPHSTATKSAAPHKRYSVTSLDYAPGGARTPNLLIRSQMLYPIELRAQTSNLWKYPERTTTEVRDYSE